MSKKIVLGMLLLIFSTSTINLPASLTEKFAPIKQKVKNSIKKVTLKDIVYYTTTVAAIGIGAVAIVEFRRLRETQAGPLCSTINNQAERIKSLETSTSSKLLGQETAVAILKKAKKIGLFPRTEAEIGPNGEIHTQTVTSLQEKLGIMQEYLESIWTYLVKLDQILDKFGAIEKLITKQEEPSKLAKKIQEKKGKKTR